MNTGYVVFNQEEATKPDHGEDFTEPGVISKLSLEGRFNNVTFENVPPSLTFNEEALRNAYSALEPGGFFYAFPIIDLEDAIKELERRMSGVGFEDVKPSAKSRYFLIHRPPLDIGSVMARSQRETVNLSGSLPSRSAFLEKPKWTWMRERSFGS